MSVGGFHRVLQFPFNHTTSSSLYSFDIAKTLLGRSLYQLRKATNPPVLPLVSYSPWFPTGFRARLLHAVARADHAVITMAQILDGKAVASDIQNNLKEEIKRLSDQFPEFIAGLAILQVGDRSDSNVYINAKLKASREVGITAQHIKLPRSSAQSEIIEAVQRLNEDPNVHGIIVQLPLDTDSVVDTHLVTNTISPDKDVDGLHQSNAGQLARGDLGSCIVPCTPRGCLELILRTGTEIQGKRAVVLGRSKIVGAPMSNLLMWNHATVTICHSKTVDLKTEVSQGDIVVVAIGQPQLVKGDWIKPGAVVIDCGINSIPDSTKKAGYRLVGDVDFESVKHVASWITPVPGGVGPMTVAMLLKNTVDQARLAFQKTRDNH